MKIPPILGVQNWGYISVPFGASGVYLFEIFPQSLQDKLISVALLCIYSSCHLFGERTRDVDRSLHILCALAAGAKDGVALLLAPPPGIALGEGRCCVKRENERYKILTQKQ